MNSPMEIKYLNEQEIAFKVLKYTGVLFLQALRLLSGYYVKVKCNYRYYESIEEHV